MVEGSSGVLSCWILNELRVINKNPTLKVGLIKKALLVNLKNLCIINNNTKLLW